MANLNLSARALAELKKNSPNDVEAAASELAAAERLARQSPTDLEAQDTLRRARRYMLTLLQNVAE